MRRQKESLKNLKTRVVTGTLQRIRARSLAFISPFDVLRSILILLMHFADGLFLTGFVSFDPRPFTNREFFKSIIGLFASL